jgi:hypothetical protein
MEDIQIGIWVAILLPMAIFIRISYLLHTKARRLINEWAERNNVKILKLKVRRFRKGPFFLTSSQEQVVYYATIEDKGQIRNAYIRCGGYWSGMASNRIEVKYKKVRGK